MSEWYILFNLDQFVDIFQLWHLQNLLRLLESEYSNHIHCELVFYKDKL